mmetsp:Transcript_34351/g.96845  ORF Transcript_34351/g.96845 Transcript_34351/m.96845 type:complete len:346 (+) Transcript_34351:279-1316(+)
MMAQEKGWLEAPEWADVQPVPQGDPEGNLVVQIEYSKDYVDATGVLRCLMARQERSERALWLTKKVIALNPAHYTAWQWRRECLEAKGADLGAEMDWVNALSLCGGSKNYQLWNHRRFLVQGIIGPLGSGPQRESAVETELAFTHDVLVDEPKHYHAWAHRQWVVQEFSSWAGELAVCERFIDADVRNNSAWNHRYFCLNEPRGTGEPGACVDEFGFCVKKLHEDIQNESAWNYLRALVFGHGGRGGGGAPGAEMQAQEGELGSKLEQACQWALEKDPYCSFAMSLLADLKLMQASSGGPGSKGMAQAALDLWQQLVKVDPMRTPYWGLRASEAQSLVLSFDLIG